MDELKGKLYVQNEESEKYYGHLEVLLKEKERVAKDIN